MADIEAAEKAAIWTLTNRYSSVVDDLESYGDSSLDELTNINAQYSSFEKKQESCEEFHSAEGNSEQAFNDPVSQFEDALELVTIDKFDEDAQIETDLTTVHKFEIDPALINRYEKMEQVVFEPLPLKRLIDKWINEVAEP